MSGRILGGSCGNVRLFSVPSPPPLFSFSLSFSLSLSLSVSPSLSLSLSLCFFSSRSLAIPFLFLFLSSSLVNLSIFSIWAGSTIRSSLTSTSLRPLLTSFAYSSSSSSLAAFGYHLGHRGHSSRCTRYVVCPIFTHGKSTLKRRWAPARSSFLSSPRMPPSPVLLLSYICCFSISADRVKIGSQRPRQGISSLFGGWVESFASARANVSTSLLHFSRLHSCVWNL